jgi:hypothetical protein
MRPIDNASPAAEVLRPFLSGANHADVKRVEGALPLDRFLLGMLTYFPWWLRLLYRLRAGVPTPPIDAIDEMEWP